MAGATMPSEGSLDSMTVEDLLQAMAAERRTGLLRFHGGDPRLAALDDGQIYLATSASGPSIHRIVVGSGAAPEAAWVEATQRDGGIAALLDDDERVDSARLRAVLQELIVSTLAELLVPGTERYEFLADQAHQLGARFCFPVDQALSDAVHRLNAWRSMSETLPSTGTRVRRAATLPVGSGSAALSPVEWQVVSSMPDEGSIADVIANAGLSAFTVFDVLHRLVRRGLVEPADGDAGHP
jgi:hypothetical protein